MLVKMVADKSRASLLKSGRGSKFMWCCSEQDESLQQVFAEQRVLVQQMALSCNLIAVLIFFLLLLFQKQFGLLCYSAVKYICRQQSGRSKLMV